MADRTAKIEAGWNNSVFGFIMKIHPINIGTKIIQFALLIDSFRIIEANNVTKKGESLVNMEAFANNKFSME